MQSERHHGTLQHMRGAFCFPENTTPLPAAPPVTVAGNGSMKTEDEK